MLHSAAVIVLPGRAWFLVSASTCSPLLQAGIQRASPRVAALRASGSTMAAMRTLRAEVQAGIFLWVSRVSTNQAAAGPAAVQFCRLPSAPPWRRTRETAQVPSALEARKKRTEQTHRGRWCTAVYLRAAACLLPQLSLTISMHQSTKAGS